jgi:hypothetical protein
MSRVCRLYAFGAVVILLLSLFTPPQARPGIAQQQRIEPNEVALRPADLAPGFTVSKETSEAMKPGPGVIYLVAMERPMTQESLDSGPIMVAQVIGRFDASLSYEGFLDELRRQAIQEDGYELVPGAPNDGGTASLQKFDGEAAAYQVGFIKRDMVIFTRWVGRKGVVSLAGVLSLAGVSSARYDELLTSRALAAPQSPSSGGSTTSSPEEATSSEPAALAPSATRGYIANTGGSGANMRAEPAVGSQLLQVVPDGELVELLGTVETGADGRKWQQIKTASGVIGWIVGEYVAAGNPPPLSGPAPTPTRAPVRTVPSSTPTPAPSRPTPVIASEVTPGLRTLYAVPVSLRDGSTVGGMFQRIATESGVSIVVGSVPGGWGAYSGAVNTIIVTPALVREGPAAVASNLAHELTHVAQARRGADPRRECVQMEVEANQVQLIVWADLRQRGLVSAGPYQQDMDYRLAQWTIEGDPGIYRRVVSSQGYQDQCNLWVP